MLRFLAVIVTWFHSSGGLPHQSADWFAMTGNFEAKPPNNNLSHGIVLEYFNWICKLIRCIAEEKCKRNVVDIASGV